MPALKPRPTAPARAPSDFAALERYRIPNLGNACRIQKLLATKPDGFTVTELSRQLQIPFTSALRILATLQLEGFVRKVGDRFELGPMLIHIGNASLAGTEIRELALPVLVDLTVRTEETSHLAIPCDDRALIVAVQDSPHPLRAASRPGFLAELHCSSTGKTFLSFLHQLRLGEFYGPGAPRPTKRTPRTLSSFTEIRREVELTRKRGYSLDDEEFAPGIRCLAAPVYASDGAVTAAIGITASTVRFTKDRIPEMAQHVAAAAAELSRRLGYHAPAGK